MSNSEHKSSTSSVQLVTIVGIFITMFAFCAGLGGGIIGVAISRNSPLNNLNPDGDTLTVNVTDESSTLIDVVEQTAPSVVSIVITKDLPIYERYYDGNFFIPRRRQVGTEEQQIGAGSGFIISEDGLIVTNRHVVSDTTANYTVVLNDDTRLEAKVLARDTLLDIAVIKVTTDTKLAKLELGDSDAIKLGQTAIAIGNSLGRFSNSISSGIISGLGRSIVASSEGGEDAETLEGVIQTDASINPGNSGGPLLDIAGKVIGVNVAVAADAENIGFAIPINLVRPIVESVIATGEIRRPYLGVRYQVLTPTLAKEKNLSVEQGALVIKGGVNEPAVIAGSPAAKAGIKEGDVILQIGDTKLDNKTSLQMEIQKYKVGDKVTIVLLSDGKQRSIEVTLERSE